MPSLKLALPLVALLTLTSSLYFFCTPESLRPKTSRQLQTGRWGDIDSEFDWCERNYEWSAHVAEPLQPQPVDEYRRATRERPATRVHATCRARAAAAAAAARRAPRAPRP